MTVDKKESRDMETQDIKTEQQAPIEPIFEETKSIGQYLKEAREAKNLSIKVVAQHTKISVTNLQYLEDDDFERLPNIAYVRGFVKNYAKVVDRNVDEALDVLDNMVGSISEQKASFEEVIYSKEAMKNTGPSNESSNSSQAIKIGAFITIAFLVSFFFFKKDSSKEETPSKPEVVTKVESKIETPIVEETKKEVVSTTEPKPVEIKEEVKLEVKPVAKVPEKVEEKLAPKKEIVKQETKNEKEKEASTKKKLSPVPYPLYSISKKDGSEFLPEKYKASVIKGKQNLFINATDRDTWITYKSDDNPVKKFVLKQGRMLIIRGDEIRIFFGNVNATKVFLNNQLLDVPTRTGVKSLVVPHENGFKYNLPLFIYQKSGKTIPSDEIDL